MANSVLTLGILNLAACSLDIQHTLHPSRFIGWSQHAGELGSSLLICFIIRGNQSVSAFLRRPILIPDWDGTKLGSWVVSVKVSLMPSPILSFNVTAIAQWKRMESWIHWCITRTKHIAAANGEWKQLVKRQVTPNPCRVVWLIER